MSRAARGTGARSPLQAEQDRQRGVILWLSGLLSLACAIYVPIYLRDGLPANALVLLAIAWSGVAMFIIQWRSPLPVRGLSAGIVLLTWAAISLSVWARDGRFWDPVIEWLIVVPIAAATLMGPRGVLLWTALAIASTVSAWIGRDPVPVALAPRGTGLLVDRIGALVVVAAITATWARLRLRALAELTRYSERLDRTLKLRDDMIAQISHAFRTPLTTIAGVAGRLADLDDGRREELLNATESVLVLVENLMLLTDPELSDSGSGRDFSPAAVVERVRALLADETAGGSVAAIDAATVLEARVRGPGRVLERALVWIGRAAVEAAAEQHPALRVRVTEADGLMQRWVLSGPGVTTLLPVITRMIAEQSELLAPAGGRRSELYLALRLLQTAGVRVLCEPPALVLEVPVAAPEETGEPVAGRVLLAEDHPVNRRIIQELLQSGGWEVVTVGDGAALVAAADPSFDLLVVDCEMPVLDGIRAVERVRDNGYDGAIVMLTAHASPDVRRRALDAGANGVLIKPLRLEQLLELVVALQRERPPETTILPAAGSPQVDAGIDVQAFEFVMQLDDGADLLQRFLIEADQRMHIGCDATRPVEERVSAWHSLKGSAVSIGFASLGATAAVVEAELRAGREPDEVLLAAVQGAWRDTRNWLRQSGRAAEATPADFQQQQQDTDPPEPR